MGEKDFSKAQNTQLEHIEKAYKIDKISCYVVIVICIIVGIVISILVDVVIGLIVLFGGCIIGAICLSISRILYGFLCDVKIIRNCIETLTLTNNDEIEILKNSIEDISAEKTNNSTKSNKDSENEIIEEDIQNAIVSQELPATTKVVFVRCYKCNTAFGCNENQPIIKCKNCGATYKNPIYKEK